MAEKDHKSISVRTPLDLHRRLKRAAAAETIQRAESVSMNTLFIKGAEEYLKKHHCEK